MMKISTLALVVFCILVQHRFVAKANPSINFEKPRLKKSVSLAESQFAYSESVKQNCYVFSHHAVIEVVDPGLTGSKISIRPKDQFMSNDELCSEKYKGRQIFLNNKATYFWGSYRNYLFVRAADDFSDRERFEVFNSLTGENLWSAHRNNSKKFTLMNNGNRVSLSYSHHLKIFCNITRDKKNSCWKRLFVDYKIPDDIKLERPDCISSLRKASLSLNSEVYVFLPVMLTDLAKPRIKYLSGKATCSAAP